MGTKRVGWARIRSLINENQNALHPVLETKKGSDAGSQGGMKIIIGKNGDETGTRADPFAESATQLYDFGTLLFDGDRVFRYVGIGGSGVTAGKLLQTAPLVNANHRDCAAVATTALSSTITVTLGATATTKDQYAGGYIHVLDGPAQGLLLKIKSHPAANSAATCAFAMYDSLHATALTTSSKIDLITAAYNDLIVAPTTFSGPVVGVTTRDMTADYYGWVQIAGPCSVLYDENPTGATDELGGIMIRADAVAGAAMGVGVITGDADIAHQVIGNLMVQNDDTENVVVWLTLS